MLVGGSDVKIAISESNPKIVTLCAKADDVTMTFTGEADRVMGAWDKITGRGAWKDGLLGAFFIMLLTSMVVLSAYDSGRKSAPAPAPAAAQGVK